MRHFLPALTLTLAGLTAAGSAQAYSNAYFFGDSLSDTGNIFTLTGGATPAAPYFNGRFSNGPVWVETLADRLGLPLTDTASLQGGNNFAFGGARTSGGSIPSLLAQVGGFTGAAGSLDPGALYVVVAGGNDMRDARTNFPTMDAAGAAGRLAAAQTAAGNVRTALQLLAADGARHVLVANLPDLGATPEAFALGAVAPSSDASAQFNAQFASVISFGQGLGLTVNFLDMAGLSAAIRNDALFNGGATYGLTNALTPCGTFQGSVGISCDVSLFSDALHPSAAAHLILGTTAAGLVPEPATYGTMLLGVAAVAAATRRRAPAR